MTRSVLRQLSRSPGFSLTVVAFLGVSVAALLALATAGWALLGKPLPYPHGERLVNVQGYSSTMGFEIGFAAPMLERLAMFEQVASVGFYRHGDEMETAAGARLRTTAISASLLRMLGVRPLIGRLPAEDETDAGVLISETFWQNQLNRDPEVLHRVLELPGYRLRVIGVLPRGFDFPQPDAAIWQPLVLSAAERTPERIGEWGPLQVYARLKPGVSAGAFAAMIESRWGALPELAPMREFMGLQIRVAPLRARLSQSNTALLGQLAVATVLVLLTLAANLASLWLGRTAARQRELATRRALGADGWRVAMPVLAEIALLTIVGVALGLLLMPFGVDVLQSLNVLDRSSPLPIGFDLVTVLLAVLSAMLLIVLLSLGPLWLIRRGSGAGGLNGSARALALNPGGTRLRRGLVAFQVAVAMTLLVGGGLLLRSMGALLASDTGFSGRDFVMAAVVPKDVRVAGSDLSAGQRVAAWYGDVSTLPGVKASSFASAPPFSQSEIVSSVRLTGDEHAVSVRDRIVGPRYFDLIRQPVVAGRAFARSDTAVVIVDELFATRNLPGIDPLQARIGMPTGDGEDRPMRVIGVVPTIKHASLDESASLGTVYRQVADPGPSGILPRYVLLESDETGVAMRTRLEELARAHGLRLERADTIDEWMRASLSTRTPLMWLIGGFSVTCLLLCCTGLFALVQFTVRSRRGEFGLKLALGATAELLSRQVLLGALRSMWLGMALGVIGALAIGRLLSSRLYQVSPYDPVTLALVAATLLAVAMAAAWWPARHAGRVAPIEALRQE